MYAFDVLGKIHVLLEVLVIFLGILYFSLGFGLGMFAIFTSAGKVLEDLKKVLAFPKAFLFITLIFYAGWLFIPDKEYFEAIQSEACEQ